jgi:hypothetical protein
MSVPIRYEAHGADIHDDEGVLVATCDVNERGEDSACERAERLALCWNLHDELVVFVRDLASQSVAVTYGEAAGALECFANDARAFLARYDADEKTRNL